MATLMSDREPLSKIHRFIVRTGFFETAALATLFILVGSILGFVKIAEEVGETETGGFDTWALRIFRVPGNLEIPIGPDWILGAARDLTALGGPAVLALVFLITAGYFGLRKKWGSLALVSVSTIGGAAVADALKNAFHRARPDLVPHLAPFSGESFPSGHSMLSAIIYLTLGSLLAHTTTDRGVKAYFLTVASLLSLMVGVTRVYLGVHFPTDVLAGWCAGTAWALLWGIAARLLQNRGVVEPEAAPGSPP